MNDYELWKDEVAYVFYNNYIAIYINSIFIFRLFKSNTEELF